MNNYEAMFIFQPSLNEEELAKLVSLISEKITQTEGKIQDTQDLGKKKLAFEIKKQKEGFYYLMNFETKPEAQKILKEAFRLNESILRVLILKKDSLQNIK
ncbi:MAG: 30S ribosomal protein S6 [Candidatus Omnitrophota bacterium]